METQDSAAPAPGYVTILQSGDPLPLPAPLTLLPPPAPAEEEGFITLSLGILQIISINDLAAAAGVRTIFVNKGSKSLVVYQHQPPPLVTTDPSTDLCFTKVAIPRLRVQKKAKKTRKTYVRKKLFKSKKSTVSLKPTEGSSDHNESSETIFSDDILTNNEEMEIIEETIKEDTEQTEKIALSKEKRKSGGIVSEEDKKKLETRMEDNQKLEGKEKAEDQERPEGSGEESIPFVQKSAGMCP